MLISSQGKGSPLLDEQGKLGLHSSRGGLWTPCFRCPAMLPSHWAPWKRRTFWTQCHPSPNEPIWSELRPLPQTLVHVFPQLEARYRQAHPPRP